MLKPAQLYAEELQRKNTEAWYKPENIFWNGGYGDSSFSFPDDNYNRHCFVSVDKNNQVIGYIGYEVDWAAMSAYGFEIINYDKGNLEFVRDLYQAICDLAEDIKLWVSDQK